MVRRLSGLFAVLVVAVSLTGCGDPEKRILYSTSSDRANAKPLDGARVSGPIYVFYDRKYEANTDAVTFLVDINRFQHFEQYAPYDLNGGSVPAANSYDLRSLGAGRHMVTAIADRIRGKSLTFTAFFTVASTSTTTTTTRATTTTTTLPPTTTTTQPPNINPALTSSKLPAALGNYFPYNTSSLNLDSLTTAYDKPNSRWRQYFVYAGTDRQQYITARTLPAGSWETPQNLKAVLGDINMVEDSHNVLVVGVDPEGYIHVTGNMHATPLLMARSVKPHDLSEFVTVNEMIPGERTVTENQVTYPQFFINGSGELMFAYRNGHPGDDGKWYLNKWNPNEGTPGKWQRVAQLTEGSGESFYPNPISVDRSTGPTRGRIHLFGTWRVGKAGEGEPPTNEDLVHYYSDDNGKTWYQYGSSTPVSMPIKREEGARILDTKQFPNSSYIMNQTGLEIDSQGRPHALVQMSKTVGVKSDLRQNHVWYDGAKWQIQAIEGTSGTGRSMVVTTKQGAVYGFLTPRNVNNVFGAFLIDLTPGSATYGTRMFPVAKDVVTGISTAYDRRALYERNELSFLVSPTGCRSWSGAMCATHYNDDNWKQTGYIVTINLDKLSDVANGRVTLPGVNLRNTTTLLNGPRTINATGRVQVVSSPSIADESTELYVRLKVTARVNDPKNPLTLKAFDGSTGFGRLDFDSTSSQTKQTPWISIRGFDGGSITAGAEFLTGAGSGVVENTVLEIGFYSREN